MDQTHLKQKALPIAIFSFLAIGGVAGTIANFPLQKRQGLPLKAR
ncbi:hypothetical protein ACFPYN_05165 [Paenisporosarcina macmurdoensis]|uniref:Uncharacterized protein n=1 Tax=Paenisporosarcina macmurdoensis TaxID=212659 RepID=A0ABW1L688_9BACL